MQRHEVQELQAQRSYPSISLYMPVYSASQQDRQQTSIRLKNLVREAEARLLQDLSKQEAAPLLAKLEKLSATVESNWPMSGLGLFVSANYVRAFPLPMSVEERVLVGNTFVTRELVRLISNSPRYRVLVLTEEDARLLEGVRSELHEIHDHGFPAQRDIPGVETEVAGHFGVEPTTQHDAEQRVFFNRVEKLIIELNSQVPRQLIVCGVQRTVAYLDEVLNAGQKAQLNIVGQVHGNFSKQKPQPSSVGQVHGNFSNEALTSLGDKTWAVLQQAQEKEKEHALFRLEEAVGPGRAAMGIESVWHEAQKGRVDTLLVEEDFRHGAKLGHMEQANGDLQPDAVDAALEAVINASGSVVFVPSGQLSAHGQVAAILRY